jgi:hypothetical protein
MRHVRSFGFISSLVTLLLGVAGNASAVTVAEGEDYTFEIRGLGEAGYVVADEASPRLTGPYLGMARLSARMSYNDLGRIFIQYEAASGQARLLDLLAALHVTDWFHVRFGYFKTPVSVDYNITSAQRPFPARAMLTELTPKRRSGVEAMLKGTFGDVTTNLHVGAFNPRPIGQSVDAEVLLAARGEVKWPVGFGVHVGYSDHFGTVTSEDPADPLYMTEPRLIDFALTFQNTRWFAHTETLLAPHRDDVFAATYAALGYRFGNLRTEPTLEPIIGYDYVVPVSDQAMHRIRGGLNAYLLDYRVVPNLHYELTFDGSGQTGHAVLALLRMSL